MLLIDGVKYLGYAPKDEDDLENMVQEHAKDIFGSDCLYFDLKHKLKGNSVAAIPDGYAITFNPDQWWIVEVELSIHPVYEHIQNQVGRFIAALPNPNTRPEVTNALWREINADKIMLAKLQNSKGNEIYKWLSDLVNQQPQLAIIIDKNAQGLDDAIAALKIQPTIVEFATYTRENVGIDVHAHGFEPLWRPKTNNLKIPLQNKTSEGAPLGPDLSKEITLDKNPRRVTINNLLEAGLLTPNQKIFQVYRGIKYEGLILPDGMIKLQHDESIHKSLSSAAEHIIKPGQIHNDKWHGRNGWTWWKTVDSKGNEVLLNELWKS